MFTGLIQSIGCINTIKPIGTESILTIDVAHWLDDVQVGDSIAVNGVCLTVVTKSTEQFTAHVSQETLRVTTGLTTLNTVNLEKALRLSDRLGGHLVSGHVDGVGIVRAFSDVGDSWKLDIQAPHALAKFIASKGSIAVNGVSLTINSISPTAAEQDVFSVNLIPHTLAHTTLQSLQTGFAVNLEIDQIARYVERMTQWQQETPTAVI